MNTAALLPTPAARPQRGFLAEVDAETTLSPDEGFAVALVASLDAAAEPPVPPVPLPLTQEAAAPAETPDGQQALDPQSAFALAALGLLAVALPPQAVAPAVTGSDAMPAAEPAPTVVLAPVAEVVPTVVSALVAEAVPTVVSAPVAESMPRTAPVPVPVAPSGEPRPALATDPVAPAQDSPSPAASADAYAQAVPASAAAKAEEPAPEADETTQAAPQKAERAGSGAELTAAAPMAAPLRPAAAPAMLQPAITLKGEPTQWQQPLLQALGDRLQLQIAARSDQAVIRLEPPMLGQVEIAIRQQAGDLQVRIAASHDEVTRQIQQVGEQLRQSLVQRHSGDVSVQVLQPGAASREAEARGGAHQQAARDGQQQARQEQQQQRRPGRGLDGAEVASFAADLASMKA
ncbi:flagellar hook-length control protein FliK [Roseateles sp.]|uniref:flagellar hook-length control protein FliK n=1 Tax=Roseateles sp. TaxID=1971397 RepID=UPI0025DB3119|nr:flagellar hook-length control protein FliK [Roseateles sp.]MBV8036777.1 flagellar hook-length control protein FliK [Roseateles sp.]